MARSRSHLSKRLELTLDISQESGVQTLKSLIILLWASHGLLVKRSKVVDNFLVVDLIIDGHLIVLISAHRWERIWSQVQRIKIIWDRIVHGLMVLWDAFLSNILQICGSHFIFEKILIRSKTRPGSTRLGFLSHLLSDGLLMHLL